MYQQPISARCLLLLVLGVLMFSDNQATSLVKRRKTSEDVDANLNSVNTKLDSVLEANRKLNIKLDTLVESVDKSRRKSKEETEKLEERAGKIIERLNNKTEQLSERLDNKTEQLRERLGNMSKQLSDQMKSQLALQKKIAFLLPSEFFSDFYKGKVYLLSKLKKKFNLDRDEKKCESLGGYLLEPDDLDEVHFVTKFVNRAIGYENFYTGINDISNEGHFVHKYSGKPLKVDFWQQGQPDGGDCTVISNSKLGDIFCDYYPYRFVCEVPLQSL